MYLFESCSMSNEASHGFSIILPVYNESETIRDCLSSLLDATLPGIEFEFLIVDGMSDDGTREIVTQYPSIRLIDNEQQTTPTGFNRGFDAASNDIIVLMSGHARVSSEFFSHILEMFENRAPDADIVGSRVKPVGDGYVQTSIAGALMSRFGAGSKRFQAHEGYVDTVSYGAYKREVIETVGKMNPDLPRGQDYEYNRRAREHGFTIYQSAESTIQYEPRSTYLSLFKQKFGNGRGKASIYQESKSQSNCGMGLFSTTLVLASLTLILPGVLLALALLSILYVGGIAFTASTVIQQNRELSKKHAVGIILSLNLIHIGYTFGFITEFVLHRSD